MFGVAFTMFAAFKNQLIAASVLNLFRFLLNLFSLDESRIHTIFNHFPDFDERKEKKKNESIKLMISHSKKISLAKSIFFIFQIS